MSSEHDYTAIFMASCAYIDESSDSNPSKQQTDMEAAIGLFPGSDAWSITTGGWGPANNDSQLAFVAANQTKANHYCVSIRGTVGTSNPLGWITEWWKNLDFLFRESWPYATGRDIEVSKGFNEDFNDLIVATDSSGNDLLTFLQNAINGASGSVTKIMVAGHSLGGALTTLVASWLANQLTGNFEINPYSFAAPTAGNPNFATAYDALFNGTANGAKWDGKRWVNTNDGATYMYDNMLSFFSKRYPAPGQLFKAWLISELGSKDGLAAYDLAMAAAFLIDPWYRQTNSQSSPSFPGVAPTRGETFTASVLANHDHWVYFNVIAPKAGQPAHATTTGQYASWPYPPVSCAAAAEP